MERFGGASEVVGGRLERGVGPRPRCTAGWPPDLFSDASITVVADASGAYPSDPGINAYIGKPVGDGQRDPRLARQRGRHRWPSTGCQSCSSRAGTHAPRARFARYDNAFDSTQEFFAELAGFDASSIDQLMHQNEALIEAAGVNQASYMAPGADHTILGRDLLYTQEVEGRAVPRLAHRVPRRHRRRRRNLRGLLIAGHRLDDWDSSLGEGLRGYALPHLIGAPTTRMSSASHAALLERSQPVEHRAAG